MPRVRFPKIHLQCKVYLQRDSVFFVHFTDAVKKDPSSTSLQRWVKEHLMMDWVTTKDAKGLGSFFLPIQLRMINAPKMHLRK